MSYMKEFTYINHNCMTDMFRLLSPAIISVTSDYVMNIDVDASTIPRKLPSKLISSGLS